MKFVSIDVETANADMASICSIGIATFEDGRIIDEYYSLLDPHDQFESINVRIHGIDAKKVKGAPTFRVASNEVRRRVDGVVAITHSHFDRVALHKASQRWDVKPPDCTWLDTVRVARRTWSDCAQRGYGLRALCERIGFEFQHHNALEDAKAAGQILLAAMTNSSLGLDDMLRRVNQPIARRSSSQTSSTSSSPIKLAGNPNGPLFGEVVVFTGALDLPRREAAEIAAKLGCEVAPNVSKKTTLLVVGDADVTRLAGHEKSTKHRRAEELIAEGIPLRILRESDFRDMVGVAL